MAKSQPSSSVPVEQDPVARILSNPTLEVIRDRRGPRVLDPFKPSMSGIDPKFMDADGIPVNLPSED